MSLELKGALGFAKPYVPLFPNAEDYSKDNYYSIVVDLYPTPVITILVIEINYPPITGDVTVTTNLSFDVSISTIIDSDVTIFTLAGL